MTNFKVVFREMLRQKNRNVYLLLLIQLAASIILTIISFISDQDKARSVVQMGPGLSLKVGIVPTLLVLFAGTMLGLSMLAEFVYLIWSSRQQGKINHSQTWRLISLNDHSFLAANFFSSIISYIWLVLLQGIVTCLSLLPIMLNSRFITALNKLLSRADISSTMLSHFSLGCLQFLIFALILGLAWYVTIDLIAFVSQTINDFLPLRNGKALLLLFRLVLLIIVLILLTNLGGILNDFLFNNINVIKNANFNNQFWLLIVEFLVYDAILFFLDNALFGRFIEAKQDN